MTLIPVAEDIISIELSKNVKWVLIVEKEVHTQSVLLLPNIKNDLLRLGCFSNAPSIVLYTTPILATRSRNHDNRIVHSPYRSLP